MSKETDALFQELEKRTTGKLGEDIDESIRKVSGLLDTLAIQPANDLDIDLVKAKFKKVGEILKKCVEKYAILQNAYEHHSKNVAAEESELSIDNWDRHGDIEYVKAKHQDEVILQQEDITEVKRIINDLISTLERSKEIEPEEKQLYWTNQMYELADKLKDSLEPLVKPLKVESEHGLRKLILSLGNRISSKRKP